MGGIDIIPYYEFTGSMDPLASYQIIKVYDSNIIKITTNMDHIMDRPSLPSPRDTYIK